MNEKTPEQIREESDRVRAIEEGKAVERGALPAEQPPRVVHGHPAELANANTNAEALPPSTAEIPPTTVIGDVPGATGSDSLGDYQVGEDGVRRYSGQTVIGVDLGAEGGDQSNTFEHIDGRQDIVTDFDSVPPYQPLGANANGEHGVLSDEFPFTDEYTEGKVLRSDGAIVWADGSSISNPDGTPTANPANTGVFAPPLTGVAEAGPYEGSPQQAADQAAAALDKGPDDETPPPLTDEQMAANKAHWDAQFGTATVTGVDLGAPAGDTTVVVMGEEGLEKVTIPAGESVFSEEAQAEIDAEVAAEPSEQAPFTGPDHTDVDGPTDPDAATIADNPPDADTTAEAEAEDLSRYVPKADAAPIDKDHPFGDG